MHQGPPRPKYFSPSGPFLPSVLAVRVAADAVVHNIRAASHAVIAGPENEAHTLLYVTFSKNPGICWSERFMVRS